MCAAHACLARRFRVVYRLVGRVYLMLVAGAGCNTLWLLRLADAATRVLLAAARGVEVTPDKLATRYPEVRPTWRGAPPSHPCARLRERHPPRACCPAAGVAPPGTAGVALRRGCL